MSKTLEAVFDGEVLRPEDKTGLQPHARYRVTVEEIERPAPQDSVEYPLNALLRLATDMGVSNLAARHDEYAHGKLAEHDHTAE
jgi:hypothetical protein